MARINKKRSGKDSVAIVVDGKNEKWYINKIKSHYQCEAINSIKIRPELPERKKVQELFDFAKGKLEEEYTFVVLILDLDEVLKDAKEFEKFRTLYGNYLLARGNQLTSRQKKKYGWMSKILVVVNNPCLEYWYLLHFHNTRKFFSDYQSLLPELKRNRELDGYDKSEDYYNCPPDIYKRLEGKLGDARNNAIPFDIENCRCQGGSEMNLLFNYFDSL